MKKEAKVPVIYPEKIFLLEVMILKSSVNSLDSYLENLVKPDKIRLDFRIEPSYEFSKNLCRFRLHINLDGQNEAGLPLGVSAEFLFDFIFVIENFTDFVSQVNENIQIQAILGATLLGISFSTARGIIFERLNGTPISGFVLPVINPTKALLDAQGPAENETPKLVKRQARTRNQVV